MGYVVLMSRKPCGTCLFLIRNNPTVYFRTNPAIHSLSEIMFSEERTVAGSYRDLIAWQKAMVLVKEIYLATQALSREELYGLRSQLRRAAVSVPSNIAEGQARYSRREFHHFLNNARGSLAEVETQIMLAGDLGYLTANQANVPLDKSSELGRILNGLIAATKSAV
jgi:four helix bundle protein